MAVLEQIRTKAGWLILVIISVALLSFIIDPTSLQSVQNMFSSKNDVGSMNGSSISYRDYAERENYYQSMLYPGQQSLTDQMQDEVKAVTWNSYFTENVLNKQYDKLGIGVSDEEMADLAMGEHLSPIIAQRFADPQTGNVDVATLDAFWQNPTKNPNQQQAIVFYENEIRQFAELSKYMTMLQKSYFVNNLQVQNNVAANTSKVEFNYVASKYPMIADTTIKIADSEISNYYNAHLKSFEQTDGRDVEYVVFPIVPSQEDFDKAKADFTPMVAEFSKSAEPLQYALSKNTWTEAQSASAKRFYAQNELQAAVADFAFSKTKEDMLPLYLDGNVYRAVRINDVKMLPDSVRLKAIFVGKQSYQDAAARTKADSIYKAVRADRAKFADLALKSIDPQSAAKGGDLGWVKSNEMGGEIGDSCFFNPVGKIMMLDLGQTYAVIEITARGAEHKKVQLATIEREVMASQTTVSRIHASANELVVASNKNYNNFHKYITEKGLQSQEQINVHLDDKQFAGLDNVRELIHWIFDAKQGDVSNILEINNRKEFIVAAVTRIKTAGVASLADEKNNIINILRIEKQRDAVAEKLKAAMSGASDLETIAEKIGSDVQQVVEPVTFSSNYIPGLGVDTKLIAAVTASDENKLYGPVKGEQAAYAYVITSKQADAGYTTDLGKMQIERIATQNNNMGLVYDVLMKAANVKDVRGKFY